MDDITDFLYLIGSVFAPMIAVQIADFFILKAPSREDHSISVKNMIIWGIGFIIHRILMNIDTAVGNTLPDMVITIAICIITSLILRRLTERKGMVKRA
jgi:purine-cytosine permease-like protein